MAKSYYYETIPASVLGHSIAATAMGPLAIIPYLAMVEKIENSQKSYKDILRNILANKPSSRTVVDFVLWQAVSSGFGYTGVGSLVEHIFPERLHEPLKLCAAGVVTGTVEAACTYKYEKSFVNQVVSNAREIPVRRFITMSGLKNAPFWVAGGMASGIKDSYELSPTKGAGVAMGIGMLSTVVSMPLQAAMFQAVANGKNMAHNYNAVLRSGSKSISGILACATYVGLYNVAAFCAFEALDTWKSREEERKKSASNDKHL